MVGLQALIFGTWMLASVACRLPAVERAESFWMLPAVLVLGSSGSLVALCVA